MRLTFCERETSAVGSRVRAVGMIFFQNEDLLMGRSYKIIPKKHKTSKERKDLDDGDDFSDYCLEVVDNDGTSKAVLNKSVARLLLPILTKQDLEDAEYVVRAEW